MSSQIGCFIVQLSSFIEICIMVLLFPQTKMSLKVHAQICMCFSAWHWCPSHCPNGPIPNFEWNGSSSFLTNHKMCITLSLRALSVVRTLSWKFSLLFFFNSNEHSWSHSGRVFFKLSAEGVKKYPYLRTFTLSWCLNACKEYLRG